MVHQENKRKRDENMASHIGSITNVKIFVLYLMENINYPLDFITINDIVMQTDYVMYLDFAEAFNAMLDGGLVEKVVEDGEEKYRVTDKGAIVARELKSDIIKSKGSVDVDKRGHGLLIYYQHFRLA